MDNYCASRHLTVYFKKQTKKAKKNIYILSIHFGIGNEITTNILYANS